jgi:DNA helicase-2/ATP-dependent DNA helicase PcrA
MIDTAKLNEAQKKAVLSQAKYLRIIAGAGSGKTRVLTMHIVYLMEEMDIFPNKILAITFTNKAANEMKERVMKMMNDPSGASPFISTIHSLCVRILREDIMTIGYPRNFTICDADDQKSILKAAYKEKNMDAQRFPYSAVLSYISNNKAEGIDPDKAAVMAGRDEDESLKAYVYDRYEKRLKELYALDFDDLILKTVGMFAAYPEVLAKWQRRFHCILVDEFQDIDRIQYRLIRQLTGKDNSLLVVGDPDQTIYTWRGADVDIIMNFPKDFPGCETIVLNENYRSTEAILNGANSVIQHNRHRVEKDLFTSRKSSEKIQHYAAINDEFEAAWIASKIKELHKNGKPYHDMAVLYRSNYLSRQLEKGLRNERIPYIIYGGLRFYERLEVKDALCYLRMCAGADDLAFNRIINKPKRGIGARTLEKIAAQASADGTSEYEALKNHPNLIGGKAGAQLSTFVNLVEGWRLEAAKPGLEIDTFFMKILKDSGYLGQLEKDKEYERIENIKELVDDAREFMEDNPDSPIDEYLQAAALYGDREETMDSDFLQLMTVHAAKGLEFDTVFVSDLNEGIFPNQRALDESSRGVEEERRLAYVAFTRAQNHLYLTEAGGFSYVLQEMRMTSRFIKEIDPAWIQHAGSMSHSYREEKPLSALLFDDEPEPITSKLAKAGVPTFQAGDHVVHQKFGEGVVIRCQNGIVQIAFAYPYGVKSISAHFPGLQKKESLKN